MCGECSKIDPSMAADVIERHRSAIANQIEVVDGLLKTCVSLEDQYRLIGFSYHTTEYSARETMADTEDLAEELAHVEDYFELKHPYEYDLWAKRITEPIEKLTKLRSDMMHIPRQATAEQLVHEYEQVISPAIRDLKWTLESEQGTLMELAVEVIKLYNINVDQDEIESVDSDGEGPLPWWAECSDPATGKVWLNREDEEWEGFLRWMSCLPETRKAMAQGQELRNVAMAWIVDRETGEVPLRQLRIRDGRVV